MGNLTATPGWDNVYEIEVTDPLQGGPGGILNLAPQALLDRTEFLKSSRSDSLANYLPVGDGITDDTAKVQAAVSACYTSGNFLYWPDKVYLTTASIANLHNVRHVGPGAIKRGSFVFHVSPNPAASTTNNLYVSTSGNDANDGLDASTPMATPRKATDSLFNYGPVLTGYWQVNIAAGTYSPTQQGIYMRNLKSINSIFIAGPAVGGSPNVPTAIIDGSSCSVGYGIGAFFAGGMRVQIQDVKFTNWGTTSSEGGVEAEEATYLYLKNTHVDTAYYACVKVFSGYLYIDGGIFKNCTFHGIHAQDCQFVIGANGGASSNRVAVQNCNTGFHMIGGSADGHLQFTDFSGSGIGRNVWLNDGARCQFDGNTGTGASIADVYGDGGSSLWENTPSVWGSSIPYLFLGASTRENDSAYQSLPFRTYLTSQIDKTDGSGVALLSSPSLPPGTYAFEWEGDGTAGAGGIWLNVAGTATVSYLRTNGQLWSGTTMVYAGQNTATSGVPNANPALYPGLFTHFRVTATITIATAGTVILRFAQDVTNAATSSIYKGAVMRWMRIG